MSLSSSSDVISEIVRPPPKHAFQLRVRGMVNAVFSPQVRQNESDQSRDLLNDTNELNYTTNSQEDDDSDMEDENDMNDMNDTNDISGGINVSTNFRRTLSDASMNWWGRPYSSRQFLARFWLQSIPSAIIIGTITGLTWLSVKLLLSQIHSILSYFHSHLGSSQYFPIWVSLTGATILSLIHAIYALFFASPIDLIPTNFYKSLHSQQEQTQTRMIPVLVSFISSIIAVISGAPIGPEFIVVVTAFLIAKLYSWLNRFVVSSNQYNELNSLGYFFRCRDSHLHLQVSLAASVSSLFFIFMNPIVRRRSSDDFELLSCSILFGPLCLLEWNRLNNSTVSLDKQILLSQSFQSRDIGRQQEQRNVQGLYPSPISNQNTRVSSRSPINSLWNSNNLRNLNGNQYRSFEEIRVSNSRFLNDHDFIEIITLQVVAVLAAVFIIRIAGSSLFSWMWAEIEGHRFHSFPASGSSTFLYINGNASSNMEIKPTESLTSPWQLLIAFLIGAFFGFLSLMVIIIKGLFSSIRRKIVLQMSDKSLFKFPLLMLFPILAGLLNGLLTQFVTPYNAGLGLNLLELAIEGMNSANRTTESILSNPLSLQESFLSSNTLDDNFWMKSAATRATSLVLVLGLGGYVGWLLLPLCTIGLCVGSMLGSARNFCTPYFTIPCCIAAASSSICPMPFSTTYAAASFIFFVRKEASLGIVGSVFASCLSAWLVTGGLGLVRYLETKFSFGNIALNNLPVAHYEIEEYIGMCNDNRSHYFSNDMNTNRLDDQLLHDVRSTLFGNG